MAQHQEVAKLVAYAAFRGELPTVGPLLLKRPDLGAQNERMRRTANDEERWFATLREKSERRSGALAPPPPDAKVGAAGAGAQRGGAEGSSAGSAAMRRGTRGIGGGADAARGRVRSRTQLAREFASLRGSPLGSALHFRRTSPYTALHTFPSDPSADVQGAALDTGAAASIARFGGSSASLRRSVEPEALRQSSLRTDSPPAYATHTAASLAACELAAVSAVSVAHARAPARVGFGASVRTAPLERSQSWTDNARFWQAGDSSLREPGAVDSLSRGEAATRARTNVAARFEPPGRPRWGNEPPPVVGTHLGPGAYARPYGERERGPWELRSDDASKASASFASHPARERAHRRPDKLAHVAASPDGVLIAPGGTLPSEFAQYTFSTVVKARETASPLSIDGGRIQLTLAQQQRLLAERKLKQVEAASTALAADPANESLATRPMSAPQQLLNQHATLVELGGSALPPNAPVTPQILAAVATRVLSERGQS